MQSANVFQHNYSKVEKSLNRRLLRDALQRSWRSREHQCSCMRVSMAVYCSAWAAAHSRLPPMTPTLPAGPGALARLQPDQQQRSIPACPLCMCSASGGMKRLTGQRECECKVPTISGDPVPSQLKREPPSPSLRSCLADDGMLIVDVVPYTESAGVAQRRSFRGRHFRLSF